MSNTDSNVKLEMNNNSHTDERKKKEELIKNRLSVEPNPGDDYYEFIFYAITSSTWQSEDNKFMSNLYRIGLRDDKRDEYMAKTIYNLIFNCDISYEYKGKINFELLKKIYSSDTVKDVLIDKILEFISKKGKFNYKYEDMSKFYSKNKSLLSDTINSYCNSNLSDKLVPTAYNYYEFLKGKYETQIKG